MIHGLIEFAYDNGADMIATLSALRQANVEIYQDEINQKFGSNFNMPVVYYCELISVADGRSSQDTALDG